MTGPDVALFIEPQSRHFLNDRLFVPETARYGGDNVLAAYVALREHFAAHGIPVHTVDRLEASTARKKIYVSLGMRQYFSDYAQRDDVVMSAFFAIECPVVEPAIYRALPALSRVFKRVYSWSDSETLRPLTKADLKLYSFSWPQSFDAVHEELWGREGRKFLVMMNANKLPSIYWNELYTERLRAVEFFSRTGDVDLFGRGWDGPPFRLGYGGLPGTVQYALREGERFWRRIAPDPLLSAARKAWKGSAESKSETISQYTFALCFENARLKGWITEKMFDCFFAGTIPIYWGAPEIAERIPLSCFIDMRKFTGYEDLRRHLKSMSPSEIRGYRENARDFVSSDAFRPFGKAAFVDIFRDIVAEDAGVRL